MAEFGLPNELLLGDIAVGLVMNDSSFGITVPIPGAGP